MSSRVQYVFRRPRFPIICAVNRELIAATSPAAFQREVQHLDLQGTGLMDIVDATGEGWAFHPDLMVVSPLTLKKRWKKIDVIQLFNESDNSLRIRTFYPEAYIPPPVSGENHCRDRGSYRPRTAEKAPAPDGDSRCSSISARQR